MKIRRKTFLTWNKAIQWNNPRNSYPLINFFMQGRSCRQRRRSQFLRRRISSFYAKLQNRNRKTHQLQRGTREANKNFEWRQKLCPNPPATKILLKFAQRSQFVGFQTKIFHSRHPKLFPNHFGPSGHSRRIAQRIFHFWKSASRLSKTGRLRAGRQKICLQLGETKLRNNSKFPRNSQNLR